MAESLESSSKSEKTIFEIVETSTVVFSDGDIETLITIDSSGYTWWYKADSGNYLSADFLAVSNDLKRIDIVHARKTASDWFNWELGLFVEKMCEATTSDVAPPLVEPGFADDNKKDAHTEHCCIVHRFCLYNSKKCSVLSGRKKQSYACRCKTG